MEEYSNTKDGYQSPSIEAIELDLKAAILQASGKIDPWEEETI